MKPRWTLKPNYQPLDWYGLLLYVLLERLTTQSRAPAHLADADRLGNRVTGLATSSALRLCMARARLAFRSAWRRDVDARKAVRFAHSGPRSAAS